MTQLHPDDQALLEGLTFSQPHSRPSCDRCKQTAVTAIVMMVQGNSGAGWDVRYCRPCVSIRFITCRRLGGRGYVPSPLPATADQTPARLAHAVVPQPGGARRPRR